MAALRTVVGIVASLILGAVAARAESPPDAAPQLRIEAGSHVSIVRRVAASADGTVLVTGSDDKTVRVWQAATGRLERVLRVPTGPGDDGKIFSVAISPDGRVIAAGGWDHTDGDTPFYNIYVFDRQSGAIVRRLGPAPNVVDDLAFSPDGAYLAAGFGIGGISVWTVADWNLLGSDPDYGGGVYSLTFAANGAFAAAAHDGTLHYYEPGFRLVTTMPAPSGANPDGIALSADGKTLAVGYDDTPAIDLLSVPRLTRRASVDVSGIKNGGLAVVAWSADGSELIAAGDYNTPDERMPVFVWDKRGLGKRRQYDAAGDTIMDMTALPNGDMAIVAGDHTLTVLDGGGRLKYRNGPVSADMRGKLGDALTVSDEAERVRFGLGVGGRDPWMFDLRRLTFAASPQKPGDLHKADVDSAVVENWSGGERVIIGDTPVKLDEAETSRSLALSPDGLSLVLGTDWALRRYTLEGRLLWQRTIPEVAWGVNYDRDGRLIVAAHLDGTVRWYRAEDGAELLALFVHAIDKRWIAWTPKGYFAASPGGESLMGWQVNRGWTATPDFFPASQFHDRFYRPDVVKLVLEALDEDAAIAKANDIAKRKTADPAIADVLPPVVEILDPATGNAFSDTQVTLRYRVHSPSGKPITGIEVLIDGRPPATRGVASVETEEGDNDIEINLPRRPVEVSLIARNEDGASLPATVALVWQGAAEAPPAAKLHAVVVGISDYDDSDLKLNYADDDARDLTAFLESQDGRAYQSVDARILTDKEATAENIREALTWLEDETAASDTAVLFLAGHGVTDLKQRFYFLPVGADPRPDRLRATGISETEIQEAISNIAGKAVFLIDACHSAAGLDGVEGVADVTGVVNRMARADTGVVMFASSTGREVSFERQDWHNGAFTEALLEGLKGKADYQKDGRITIAELNLWLSTRVAELTEERQNAVMLKPDTIRDFALARLD